MAMYRFLYCIACLLTSGYCALVIDLNGQWEVLNTNRGHRIPATVPGSIYTALMESNIIGDPYYRDNDIKYRWIGRENWTYTRLFDASSDILSKGSIILVAEGLDTFAEVIINGHKIASTNNMFVSYAFDIKKVVKMGTNNITIQFTSAVLMAAKLANKSEYPIPPGCPSPAQHGECYRNFIRKEQCSFSWDWGPSFPGQGIWKNISIDAFNNGVMRLLTATPKLDNDTSRWRIDIEVDLDIYNISVWGNFKTTLQLAGVTSGASLSQTRNIDVSTRPSSFYYAFDIKKDFPIHLWWPNGYGEQALYNLNVKFTSGEDVAEKTIRIGFRTLELVQTAVSSNSSQGKPLTLWQSINFSDRLPFFPLMPGLTFFYKVNNVPIFFKGTNWIPADSFQERITNSRLQKLLGSAAEVHINSMRVWGGGVYESEDFYNLADELGILIWQDLMYSDALYPATEDFLASVVKEIQQQVKRLMRHPSIAVWSGNNENEGMVSGQSEFLKQDYLTLYIDTIMPIVKLLDTSRPFLPSSPTNGPETKKEGWIAKNPGSEYYGDEHYYNYYGDLWDWKTFPIPRFASEFGSEAWCNYETLESVFSEADFDYNSSMADHRQHHPSGNIQMLKQTMKHITLPTTTDPKQRFKDIIYIIQIHQAMAMRTETEHYRRFTNQLQEDGRGLTMGALYWQLNDIWQAPTWASIDFDLNWKMLHYFARKFFDPNLISPFIDGDNLNVYMVIDEIPNYVDYANSSVQFKPMNSMGKMVNSLYSKNKITRKLQKAEQATSGQVIMEMYTWKSMMPLKNWSFPFILSKTSGSILEKKLDDILTEGGCTDKKECFLYFYLNSKINPTSTSWLPLTYFNKTQGVIPKANIQILNVAARSNTEFTVALKTDNPAPFVWIHAYNISGRFSDNGFLMKDPVIHLTFTSWQPVELDTFKQSLTIKSLMDIY